MNIILLILGILWILTSLILLTIEVIINIDELKGNIISLIIFTTGLFITHVIFLIK